MVRRRAIRGTVLTLWLGAFAVSADAQGLGDIAKKTDEQRKTNTVPTKVLKLSPSARDGGPLRLSPEVLKTYLRARLALADMRRADKKLDSRLYTAVKNAKHYDDLGPAYAAEADIVDVFSTFGLSTGQYLQVEAAMLRGRDYAAYPQLSMERLSPVERENVKFVKANLGFVHDVLQQARAAEQGLMWWAVIPNYL